MFCDASLFVLAKRLDSNQYFQIANLADYHSPTLRNKPTTTKTRKECQMKKPNASNVRLSEFRSLTYGGLVR